MYYQKTVLKAWQEIDDALSGYTAEHSRNVNCKPGRTAPAKPTNWLGHATTAAWPTSSRCSTASAAICKRVAPWLPAKGALAPAT